jgi:hypothetical protein
VSKPDPLVPPMADAWAECYALEFKRRVAAELAAEDLRAQLKTALKLNREFRLEFIRMKDRQRQK